MTKEFEEEIGKHIENGNKLFYNTKGSPKAYKMNIMHISAAAHFKLGVVISNHLYPHDSIYLVDLENESIKKVSEKIKIQKLEDLY